MSSRSRKAALVAILAAPISLVLGHGPANAADVASVATAPAYHAPVGNGDGESGAPSAGMADPSSGMTSAPDDGNDPAGQSAPAAPAGDDSDPGMPDDPGALPGDSGDDSGMPGGAGGAGMAPSAQSGQTVDPSGANSGAFAGGEGTGPLGNGAPEGEANGAGAAPDAVDPTNAPADNQSAPAAPVHEAPAVPAPPAQDTPAASPQQPTGDPAGAAAGPMSSPDGAGPAAPGGSDVDPGSALGGMGGGPQ
jgi:hypothetical protein